MRPLGLTLQTWLNGSTLGPLELSDSSGSATSYVMRHTAPHIISHHHILHLPMHHSSRMSNMFTMLAPRQSEMQYVFSAIRSILLRRGKGETLQNISELDWAWNCVRENAGRSNIKSTLNHLKPQLKSSPVNPCGQPARRWRQRNNHTHTKHSKWMFGN